MAIIFRNRLRKGDKLRHVSRGTPSIRLPDTAHEAPTACYKVFSTPELLEAILLHLHSLDLLLLQRISKTFQEAIFCSPTIQRRLFFRPALSPATSSCHERTINPVLPYVLRRNSRCCDIYSASGEPSKNAWGQELIGNNQDLIWRSTVKIPPEQFLLVFPEAFMKWRSYKKTAAYKTCNESWRKMLVADQPCFVEIRHIDTHVMAFMKTVKPETLGDIADLLEELDAQKTEAYNRAAKAQQSEVWGQYCPQLI